MPRAARTLFAFFWLFSLSACAPVILGRTPTPAPPGKTETSATFGWPFDLTRITVCEGPVPREDCATEYIGPDYWPLPLPLTLQVARGIAENREVNYSIMLLPYPDAPFPGVRFGGKDLLMGGPMLLAGDYGASLYLANLALDAGLLGSMPFEGLNSTGR